MGEYRPIHMVMSSALYSFDNSSNHIHGLLAGSMKVLPTMGQGNGPGGCDLLSYTVLSINVGLFDVPVWISSIACMHNRPPQR